MARGRLLLFLAFFSSGSSGLIFQTVWIRMLTRLLGATTPAVTTVLVVFMAGLALGSAMAGRIADRLRRPLVAYAGLELAIGGAGCLASFVVIRGLGGFYVRAYDWVGGSPAAVLAARVLFALLCLLPPTVLMGATLPLLVAYVTRLSRQFQAGLGWLYAVNTFGAVAGVLITGFVLLGQFGETVSLAVAAALNAAAAGLAILLTRAAGDTAMPVEPSAGPREAPGGKPYSQPIRRLAYAVLFTSGLTALAYEILWSRLLVLLLQTSIYAFSAMLATFLLGIALGSWRARRADGPGRRPVAALGLLEVSIGLWSAAGMAVLPFFDQRWVKIGDTLSVLAPLAVGGVACLLWVGPVAFFFGQQFPLAVRCCLADPDSPGQATGRAYMVNTVGTIVGSFAAGFLLIPLIGTAPALYALAGLNIALGALVLYFAPASERRTGWAAVPALSAMGLAVVVVALGDPYQHIMIDRVHKQMGRAGQIYASFERVAATTVAAGNPGAPQARSLYVNGVGMTVLCSETKLMTHLPYHLVGHPKRMLVICFGMGTTVRSGSLCYPDLEIDAVDIVPEVFDCFGYFHPSPDPRHVLGRPGVRLHSDDGRNYLLAHPDRYDVITIDPAPPMHSAGTVNLYTREFFQLCKDRLTADGVFCLWVPPAAETEMKMVMRTYLAVFPDATAWGGWQAPGFYLTGGHRSFAQTPATLRELFTRMCATPKVREDLAEWQAPRGNERFPYADPRYLAKYLYLLDTPGLARLVGDYPEISDDLPLTEFPLWRQVFDPKALTVFHANILRQKLPGSRGEAAPAP